MCEGGAGERTEQRRHRGEHQDQAGTQHRPDQGPRDLSRTVALDFVVKIHS